VILRRENRLSALEHLRFLEKSQRWSLQELQNYQWLKLRALIEHAYVTCPYYTQLLDERSLTPESFKSIEDLSLLPILTRDLVFDHLDDLISSRYNKSDLQEFSTGGTTGQQAPLFIDQESYNIKLASAWRFESWMGQRPCDRTAMMWPASMDIVEDESFRERIKTRFILRHQTYHAGSFTEKMIRQYHADILKFKPKFLRAFPAVLFSFAETIERHKLEVPRLRAIMSTGEILYPDQRQKFEQLFDCPVYDLYASREVGNTACECSSHSGMHVAMETQIVEIVGEVGSPESSREGRLIITDLTNYGMPLIRYQINDNGMALGGDCSCGRELRRIGSAVGRVQDCIWGPDGTMHHGNVLGLHLTTAEHGIEIGQAQFIQKSLKHFHVRITSHPKPTEEVFDYLKRMVKEIISHQVEVTVEVVDKIPQEKSGKTRYVICEIPPPKNTWDGTHPTGNE